MESNIKELALSIEAYNFVLVWNMCDLFANLVFVLIAGGWDGFTISATVLSCVMVVGSFAWVVMFAGEAVGYISKDAIENYFTACQVMKWTWWVAYWLVPSLITIDAIILEY